MYGVVLTSIGATVFGGARVGLAQVRARLEAERDSTADHHHHDHDDDDAAASEAVRLSHEYDPSETPPPVVAAAQPVPEGSSQAEDGDASQT